MSKLEKLYDRTDAEKWAHPEMEEGFAAGEMSDSKLDLVGMVYNTEIPFEKRKAEHDNLLNVLEWFPASSGYDPKVATTYEIPGCPEEPQTGASAIVFQPQNVNKKKLSCIVYLAPGGLHVCMDFAIDCAKMANDAGAVVVCCKYRTIYDGGGYPETINDLHAIYKWVVENAEEIGINPDKIVVRGSSSGGHLALALCHRLKRYGYQPRGCVAEVPIPDDRTVYPSSKRIQDWGGAEVFASSQAWLTYKNANPATVPPEAFANHATAEDCIGLPPTFIHTTDSEVSVDPDMEYASKLIQAGVYTDIHVWGGGNHNGFAIAERMPDKSEYVQLYMDEVLRQIKDCFKYDLRRQWIADELNK